MTITAFAPDSFQLGLFDAPAPAQAHSPTSKAAARSIEPRTGTLRGFVLAYIRGAGMNGATDEEMQSALSMNPSTQRPRRIELVEAGFVYDSNRTRPTESGRNAVVWLAVSPPSVTP
jgi:hypothetical protein